VSPGATLLTVTPLIEGLKDLYSTFSLDVDVTNSNSIVSNTDSDGKRLLNINSMGYLKASEGYWLTEKLSLDDDSLLVGRICAETVILNFYGIFM